MSPAGRRGDRGRQPDQLQQQPAGANSRASWAWTATWSTAPTSCRPQWLEGKTRVGLTAGASAPEVLVQRGDRPHQGAGRRVGAQDGRHRGDREVPAAQGPEARRRAAPGTISRAACSRLARRHRGRGAAAARAAAASCVDTPLWKLPGAALGVDVRARSGSSSSTCRSAAASRRAACNRLLANPIPASGVIVASGGNAGIATAAAAQALGVQLRSVRAHRLAAAAKQARLRELGAEVVVTGAVYAEALEACLARQQQTGALLTHAYDQPEVVAGAGTLAPRDRRAGRPARQRAGERRRRRPDRAASPPGSSDRSRVVALEPELAPTLYRAREAGEPVDVAVGGIAADSLGARRIGAIAWEITQRHVQRRAAAARRRDPRGAAVAVEGDEAGGGAGRGAGRWRRCKRGAYRAARGREGLPGHLRRQRGSGHARLTASLAARPSTARRTCRPACRSARPRTAGAKGIVTWPPAASASNTLRARVDVLA